MTVKNELIEFLKNEKYVWVDEARHLFGNRVDKAVRKLRLEGHPIYTKYESNDGYRAAQYVLDKAPRGFRKSIQNGDTSVIRQLYRTAA